MGTFEKLGILVIVVIIVMILAVAIYQWGGAASEPAEQTPDFPYPLTIRTLGELEGLDEPAASGQAASPDAATWPGGIPKTHVIRRNDKVWVLVVKRWKLDDKFIAAITAANPAADMKRLRPGQKLTIPDPSPYVRKAGADRTPKGPSAKARRYEVQIGDTLDSIAYRHLGAHKRWKDIVDLNPGLNPKRLMEGQEIYIPLK